MGWSRPPRQLEAAGVTSRMDVEINAEQGLLGANAVSGTSRRHHGTSLTYA
jgi:hypothetical protein